MIAHGLVGTGQLDIAFLAREEIADAGRQAGAQTGGAFHRIGELGRMRCRERLRVGEERTVLNARVMNTIARCARPFVR